MQRAILRAAPRASAPLRRVVAPGGARRFISSAPADRPRTWKGAAVRWGLALGALYWYNTSPVFAEELPPQTIPPPPHFSDADLPTVEAIVEEKRRHAEAKLLAQKKAEAPAPAPASTEQLAVTGEAEPSQPTSPEQLEEEAGQQGAFNPETGEINWDCPCLGGMAHGPCGEEFKAAFSCFVYSTEEPKGMDCIDKFQHMQDCFRLHPEIYGSEIDDDDEAPAEVEGGETAAGKENDTGAIAAKIEQNQPSTGAAPLAASPTPEAPAQAVPAAASAPEAATKASKARLEADAVPVSERKRKPSPKAVEPDAEAEDSKVPHDAFDATAANQSSTEVKTPAKIQEGEQKAKEQK